MKRFRNINFYHTPKLFNIINGKSLTIYPIGTFYKYRSGTHNHILLNHVSIKWQQQKELFLVFYLILFLVEFIVRLPINRKSVYSKISLIREVFTHRNSGYYYMMRKKYNWFKYLSMK